MKKRKIKNKEIEHISFAVSYSLTSAFIEENHRPPAEEEQREIEIKSIEYIFEILDKIK